MIRVWEGKVEKGAAGLIRIGGDDLDLQEVLEPGAQVRVLIEWPEEGRADLHHIREPVIGKLPPLRKDDDEEAAHEEQADAEFRETEAG